MTVIAGVILASACTLVGADAAISLGGFDAPAVIRTQVDLSGEWNVAAAVGAAATTLVCVAISRRVIAAGRARAVGTVTGWAALGVSCGTIGMFDLSGTNEDAPAVLAAACIMVGAAVILLFGDLAHHRPARWRLLLSVALLLIIALTSSMETRLISNPHNYAFVTSDQPWRFRVRPWRELWLVSRSQELAESLVMIALMACALAAEQPEQAEGSH
jgi:hypothetical protein